MRTSCMKVSKLPMGFDLILCVDVLSQEGKIHFL